LIGFKGAGKTTLGRKIALQLKRPFIDTDDLFTEPPAVLYQKIGLDAFRALEKKNLQSLIYLKGHVIATGGGTALDPQNQALLLNLGTIVHLHTSKDIIQQRISNHPFLQDYDNRLGIYNALAHYNIFTEDELWEVIHSDPFSESPHGENHTALPSELSSMDVLQGSISQPMT
jgi:shikimate kinase